MKAFWKITTGLFVVVIGSGFFVKRDNPEVTHQVNWDSEATRIQFMASCADCHSNETKWPWYSYIGPIGMKISQNVHKGRKHFNISNQKMGDADDAAEEVLEGEMPTGDYMLFHPEAALTEESMEVFVQGLAKTFGSEDSKKKKGYKNRSRSHDDEDD